MRNLNKLAIPTILDLNATVWTAEFIAEPTNRTKKYRYRNPEIKQQLKVETGFKCIYCESKIGHNTPGDVEHKIATTASHLLHFEWSNLTIACTECNRRKNDYDDPNMPFLDPYNDDVEDLVKHLGPIVSWKTGEARAEVSIRQLELDSKARMEVILRKIEHIAKVNDLLERIASKTGFHRKLLERNLMQMTEKDAEYSAMTMRIVNQALNT